MKLHSRPGTFYHVMYAADIYLRPSQQVDISSCCRDKNNGVGRPETGHACTVDYNSKLKMKKTTTDLVTQWGQGI